MIRRALKRRGAVLYHYTHGTVRPLTAGWTIWPSSACGSSEEVRLYALALGMMLTLMVSQNGLDVLVESILAVKVLTIMNNSK
jgi:uncharacterized membrane protein YhiD involved in acid resistance